MLTNLFNIDHGMLIRHPLQCVYETTLATYTFQLPLPLSIEYRRRCTQYIIDHAEILRLEANDKALRELHTLLRETQNARGETLEDVKDPIKDVWQQNIAGLSRKASKWVNESSFVRSDRENGGEN